MQASHLFRSCQETVHLLYSTPVAEGLLRVGELSRRSGVSADLLRAWERRYGLLQPTRSAGGLRLYSPTDLERVRLMKQHLAEGLAAAEAAALALRDDPAAPSVGAAPAESRPSELRKELADALEVFDEPRAQAVLDRLLATATIDTFLREIVLPYLHELGDRWERGDVSVAQEHFASGVLRGRLLGLARGWGLGMGPMAVLACLPGEQHDIGLISFGLALRSHGWRIVYLGPDCPVENVTEACRRVEARLVVLSAVSGDRVDSVLPALEELARACTLAIGGAAAADPLLESTGISTLGADLVAEAERLTAAIA
jgi:MerR family transcriptional regulator, light-induced transcriptional regulator